MSSSPRAQKLLALVDLINAAAKIAIQEWEKEDAQDYIDIGVPSLALYNSRRTIVASCGALSELLLDPAHIIFELSLGYFQSRALHIAAEHYIADILSTVPQEEGMAINTLGAKIGLDPSKLLRIMRCLCSVHVFTEVKDAFFANNAISSHLVKNDALRAFVLLTGKLSYSASVELPAVLQDTVKGHSTSPTQTAFSQSVGRDVSFFDWLSEDIAHPDGPSTPNPMLEVASLAILSAGQASGASLSHDFSWGSLKDATVVDVGGGLGEMSLQLARLHPGLKFVIQDRPAVLEQATAMWQKEYLEALESRVTMMPHNFFDTNPAKGAAVYLLRHIMHNWDNDNCVRILSAVKRSMTAASRLLIADQVANTTFGCPEIIAAPTPLPANYGAWNRLRGAADMHMMTLLNGVERTPAQFQGLAVSAGLEVVRVWECRGPIDILELRLPSTTN